jgi:bacterioferritin-associated ferredoxin
MMMASAKCFTRRTSGASMIVCVCNNISDREIAQAIELGATSMNALRADLGVATCCGNCEQCASELLEECLAAGKVEPVTLHRLIQPLVSAVA